MNGEIWRNSQVVEQQFLSRLQKQPANVLARHGQVRDAMAIQQFNNVQQCSTLTTFGWRWFMNFNQQKWCYNGDMDWIFWWITNQEWFFLCVWNGVPKTIAMWYKRENNDQQWDLGLSYFQTNRQTHMMFRCWKKSHRTFGWKTTHNVVNWMPNPQWFIPCICWMVLNSIPLILNTPQYRGRKMNNRSNMIQY